MNEPDWDYSGNGAGLEDWTFQTPVPFDQLPNPGMFYVGASYLPMTSKLARLGVRGTQTQITTEAEATATIHLRRGPLGWLARRWINRHPLQLTVEVFRPEWGEWRTQIGRVKV